MQLHTARPRKSADDSMIPLINIVFLLLIFFMIAGKISNDQQDAITPPVSQSREPVHITPAVLKINEENQLQFDGKAVTLETLAATLPQVRIQIYVKADRDLQAKDLDAVFNLLREAGVEQITLYSEHAEVQSGGGSL
ncbi:ExbD/TolR family protein [Microbulbifer sp. SA54]|uniref:ExbD/TolR family protein n=1 Tax=Microbulbifer sp. SA54 TaxID=3401577 RepID=UPI003AAEC6E5